MTSHAPIPRADQQGPSALRVGFVGLGHLGTPMAQQIISAGWQCSVWARKPDAVDSFRKGFGRVAESLTDLGRDADLLSCCLFDADDTWDVLFAPGGAARSMPAGATIAIHSTIAPHEARALANDAHRLGLDLVDAPVSGGPDRAAMADLVTMVGADTGAWTRYVPVFEAFSSLVVHVGPVGAGQLTKLLNNAMLVAHLGIADDAFELAAQLGLDRSALARVLLQASGRSRGAELVVAADSGTGVTPTQARALGKDVRLLTQVVHDGVGYRGATAPTNGLLITTAQRTLDRMQSPP